MVARQSRERTCVAADDVVTVALDVCLSAELCVHQLAGLRHSRTEIPRRSSAGRKTESEEKIQRRLQRAPEEIRHLSDYDYVVVNHEIDATQAQLEAILAAERLRRSRLTDDGGGFEVAEEYLREWIAKLAP